MKLNLGVSYASAVELGLVKGRLETRPTTLYLFLKGEGCSGSCHFCPQSSNSNKLRISRVDWPENSVEDVEVKLRVNNSLQRVCIQCSDEQVVKEGVVEVVRRLKEAGKRPITVSLPPIKAGLITALKEAGTETLTIPIDCANASLYRIVKGREPEGLWRALDEGLRIFGTGKVGTHIIVGLGEVEMDAVHLIGKLFKMGIIPSLFAFTPARGSFMENKKPPCIASYRRIQLARHLIVEKGYDPGVVKFNDEGKITRFLVSPEILRAVVADGTAFTVHGCPGCNRPYFNERVSGPFYNYAHMPVQADIERIEGELSGSLEGY